MKLERVVPWGRSFIEYKEMFLLSKTDLKLKILGCGDGPSSFNSEARKQKVNVTSIDPIYKFTEDDIKLRIDRTCEIVAKQIERNKNDFIWKNIKSVDELFNIRLLAMNDFLTDYNNGKANKRYIYQQLPKLNFEDNSFDIVLSSHFLFLYSDNFDLNFHINSILEMCRVARKDIRVFPLLDLKNNKSKYLEPVIKTLQNKGFQTEIIKTDYEFQKGAFEMLKVIISS